MYYSVYNISTKLRKEVRICQSNLRKWFDCF
nr:MAG TPA: hypothetical protein [Caudoviricetes sp.]